MRLRRNYGVERGILLEKKYTTSERNCGVSPRTKAGRAAMFPRRGRQRWSATRRALLQKQEGPC
jgi:hypothetical protein